MKKLFAAIMAIGILMIAYVIPYQLTGNPMIAGSVTVAMGLFSAFMYASGMLKKGYAFETIVIPDFTEKSTEDIEKMSAEEMDAYLAEKKAYEMAVMKKEIQDQLQTAMKENADSQTLKDLKNRFDVLVKEHDQALLEIKSLTEGKDKNKGEKSDLLKFIERDRSEDLTKREQKMDSVVVKVAALMTTANVIPNVAGGFNQLFGNYIDPEIHSAPKPDNYILPLVDVAEAPGTENIWYVERVNEEGDAEFIGEGDLKPLIDGEWVQNKADVKEVAERWKMSNRLINHAPSVISDFRTHANELMDQKIDDGVAAGDGIGNNLNGVTTLASPFIVPPQLAAFYQDPNIYDVIMAVATYVRLNNFKGNLTCVLNTVWMAKMKAIKNADGDYIIPPFVSPDGTQVGETRIVFTNKFGDGNILLGELMRFKVRISENIMYFEGWENDDFSRNLSSRKLEAFMGTYLPQNYAGSIIFDDIATILTAIEKL